MATECDTRVHTAATCCRAMGFDVRIEEAPREGFASLLARPDDAPDLVDVLDEMLDEQASFDARCERRSLRRRLVSLFGLLGVILFTIVLWLMKFH